MTIQSSTARVTYNCDGSTTVFPVPIQAYQPTDFLVIVTTAGVSTVLTYNSNYTMAQAGTLAPPQWSLTTGLTYQPGTTLLIILNPTETQLTQYQQGQAFPTLAVQTNIDRLTQMVIRLSDEVGRTIRQPDGDPTPLTVLASAANRASTLQGYDVNGNQALYPVNTSTGITTPLVLPAPSSGVALTVTASAAGDPAIQVVGGNPAIQVLGGEVQIVAGNNFGLAVTGSAGNYSAVIGSFGSTGTQFGLEVVAGTNASDMALLVSMGSGTPILKCFGDGSVVIGNPSGGPKGASTLNVQNGIWVNGTSVTVP